MASSAAATISAIMTGVGMKGTVAGVLACEDDEPRNREGYQESHKRNDGEQYAKQREEEE